MTGICGSGIIEVVAELYLASVITADGVIDGAFAARTPRVVSDGRTFSYVLHEPADGGPRIVITQNDVRAIQLAKAALYAGVRLLMDHLEIDAVDEMRLAGAFGSQIDPLHAMVLGLVPDCDLARVKAAGNAAGTGALIALLSGAARREIETVVRRVEKIETAVEPRFQEHFVEAMAIPHRTAPTPTSSVWSPCRPTRHGRPRRGCPGRTTAPARGRGRRTPPRPWDLRRRPPGLETIDERDRRPPPDGRSRGPPRRAPEPPGRAVPFLTRTMAPFEVLGEEGLAIIEDNADTILQEVGIEFRGDADALRLLAMPAPTSRASASDSRAACAARSSRRRRRASSPSTPGTRRTTSRSAACTRSSPRTTARPSCATWTAAGATARSRTSATS